VGRGRGMKCVCPQGGGARLFRMKDHGMHVLVVLDPSWGGFGSLSFDFVVGRPFPGRCHFCTLFLAMSM